MNKEEKQSDKIIKIFFEDLIQETDLGFKEILVDLEKIKKYENSND